MLLAYLGLDNETTCNGNTMHVSWQSSSGAALTLVLTVLFMTTHTVCCVFSDRVTEGWLGTAWPGKHIGEHPMSYSVKSVSLGVFLWLRQAGNMDLYCNEVATTRCPIFCLKTYAMAHQHVK